MAIKPNLRILTFLLFAVLIGAGQNVYAQVNYRETGGGSDYVGFSAPASVPANLTWILPSVDGSANQCLKTDGAGNLSWQSVGNGDFLSNGSISMSGTLKATAGSAALPSYTFNGDTDTGTWSPGANTYAISTQGSERLRVDNLGNVGIGTASPSSTLDVRPLTSTGEVLSVRPITGQSGYVFATYDGAGVSRFAVNENGTVQVSGTAGSGQNAIIVQGGTNPSYVGLGGNGMLCYSPLGGNCDASSSAGDLVFRNYQNDVMLVPKNDLIVRSGFPASTELMRVKSSGNVGIGTTSPIWKLQVNSDVSNDGITLNSFSSNSASGVLRVYKARNTQAIPQAVQSGDYLGVITFGGHYTGKTNGYYETGDMAASISALAVENFSSVNNRGSALLFQTAPIAGGGSLERVRIDSAGNVGIGTNVPSRLLHVAGAARLDPTTTPSSPMAGDIFFDSAASNVLKYHNGSGWVTVAGGGDFLAAGTVPMTAGLRGFAGTTALPGYSFNGDLDTGLFSAGANTLGVATAGSQRMVVGATGNIGIGTSSPSANLNVYASNANMAVGAVNATTVAYSGMGSQNVSTLEVAGSGANPGFGHLVLSTANTAASDTVGTVAFVSRNTSGAEKRSAAISSQLDSASGTNVSGSLRFLTSAAGTTAERMRIDANGLVGIGTTSPTAYLHVRAGSSGSLPAMSNDDEVIVQNNTAAGSQAGVSVIGGTTGFSTLAMGDSSNQYKGYIQSANSSSALILGANGTERMRITSGGSVGIGGTPLGKYDLAVRDISTTGDAYIAVGTPGTGTTQWAGVDILTFGVQNGALGSASTKGWSFEGVSDAYSTAAWRNDLWVSYWNGSAWDVSMTWDATNGSVGINALVPAATLDVGGDVKLGASGVKFTNMGVCSVTAATWVVTPANATCTGIPASTTIAVNCSASGAFSAGVALYARATGTANQIAVNTSGPNTNSVALTCMWVQP